jgi:predicted  nucleic acid-binding Zn-ribbon protein
MSKLAKKLNSTSKNILQAKKSINNEFKLLREKPDYNFNQKEMYDDYLDSHIIKIYSLHQLS